MRRNANDLTDWIDRAERVFKNYNAIIKDKNRQPYFLFPSGAKIYMGHLKDEEAYTKYQGHEYQRILIEELTQIKSELLYTKLIGSCRSTVEGLKSQVFLTTNPGGLGHGWVRRRFIGGMSPNTLFINPSTNRFAIYIPAKVEDNPVLVTADPTYVSQLEALKNVDEKLWRAWRNGEWDAFEGQVFSEFNRDVHVFNNFFFNLKDCTRICSFDWGFRAPASMHWIAYTPENEHGVRHMFIYREIYRNQTTPLQWGQLLKRVQAVDPVEYMVLPHDCFSSDQGQDTIATVFESESGIPVVQGATMAKGARKSRVAIYHQSLSLAPDGYPYLMIHDSCQNLIRTLPELVYAETNPEDVDTEGEDHAYDSSSLGLITLQPEFKDAGLVVMHKRPELPFKSGWQQNADGSLQSLDIIEALGRPERRINVDTEF